MVSMQKIIALGAVAGADVARSAWVLDAVLASSPTQYTKVLEADIVTWGEAVKRSGATSD